MSVPTHDSEQENPSTVNGWSYATNRQAPPGDYMEPKHSKLGIASFTMSILIALLIFCMFIILGVIESSTPGGMDEKSPTAIISGLFIIALLFGDVVAFGLGVGALFMANTKKLFGILGSVFSGLTLLATVVLIIIGNLMNK